MRRVCEKCARLMLISRITLSECLFECINCGHEAEEPRGDILDILNKV